MTAQTHTPDDSDSFDDVPTVANRPNPTACESGDASAREKAGHIGSYRMVHASTDVVTPPPAPRTPTPIPTKGAAKRVVIGVTRKPS